MRAWGTLPLMLMLLLACDDAQRSTTAATRDADAIGQGSISGNLAPAEDCTYTTSGKIIPKGEFDIGPSKSTATGCSQAYIAHLLATSRHRRDPVTGSEPDAFTIPSARILLMDTGKQPIDFSAAAKANPFVVSAIEAKLTPGRADRPTVGIVTLDLIPWRYTAALATQKDDRVLISITLQGRSENGSAFEFVPFVYPVDLCDNCLHECDSGLKSTGGNRTDLVGAGCDDNAGLDGRLCIDPEC